MKIKNKLFLILQLIAKKKELKSLRAYGLKREQIIVLLALALKKHYICQENKHFTITELGSHFLKGNRLSNPADWIQPLEAFKIKKIAVNVIYLPHVKNTWF